MTSPGHPFYFRYKVKCQGHRVNKCNVATAATTNKHSSEGLKTTVTRPIVAVIGLHDASQGRYMRYMLEMLQPYVLLPKTKIGINEHFQWK